MVPFRACNFENMLYTHISFMFLETKEVQEHFPTLAWTVIFIPAKILKDEKVCIGRYYVRPLKIFPL